MLYLIFMADICFIKFLSTYICCFHQMTITAHVHKLPLHQGHGRLPNLRSQIFIALDWLHGKSKKVMLVVRLFSYRQEKQMG